MKKIGNIQNYLKITDKISERKKNMRKFIENLLKYNDL